MPGTFSLGPAASGRDVHTAHCRAVRGAVLEGAPGTAAWTAGGGQRDGHCRPWEQHVRRRRDRRERASQGQSRRSSATSCTFSGHGFSAGPQGRPPPPQQVPCRGQERALVCSSFSSTLLPGALRSGPAGSLAWSPDCPLASSPCALPSTWVSGPRLPLNSASSSSGLGFCCSPDHSWRSRGAPTWPPRSSPALPLGAPRRATTHPGEPVRAAVARPRRKQGGSSSAASTSSL